MWRSDYFQTVIMILLVVMAVFGFWFGLRLALNTDYPILAVASGSMSIAQPDDGWSHPFDPTLHTGDLIVVQGVETSDIHAASYPVGDILVFHYGNELIVHRAVGEEEINGQTEFVTQGDGNAVLGLGPGPGSPTPADGVVGKVVLRIPWIGHLALLMQNGSGTYVTLALIIIILAVLLVLLTSDGKKTKPENEGIRNQLQFREV